MKFFIFDIDGTLADRDTGVLLPGVREWFDQHDGAEFRIALVTNQGGVGLRRWMEEGGFGDPDQYPCEEQAREHIEKVEAQLPVLVRSYACFAYQSKKSGKWAPTPDYVEAGDPEWDHQNRKPNPGMFLQALQGVDASPEQTIMVGDAEEDRQAAESAGVAFMWAEEFFAQALEKSS